MINEALREHLLGNSGVTDLVGSSGVYHMHAPTGSPPYIVYFRLATIRHNHFTAMSGLVRARVQTECYGSTQDEADSLADAVRLSFVNHQRGTMGTGDNATDVESVMVEGPYEETEAPSDGSQTSKTYRSILDLVITHRETVPA